MQKTTKENPAATGEPITFFDKVKGDIETFHAITGMPYATIGKRGAKNPRVYERLNEGISSVTIETTDKIYAFMAEQGHDFRPRR